MGDVYICSRCNLAHAAPKLADPVSTGVNLCGRCYTALCAANGSKHSTPTGIVGGEPISSWFKAEQASKGPAPVAIHVGEPQFLSCEAPKYAKQAAKQAAEDAEEARLVAILTRPANKDYCMCGIHRDRCDYHRPQAPKLEKRPGGEGVMTYYDALGNPHKAVFRDGVWFEVT